MEKFEKTKIIIALIFLMLLAGIAGNNDLDEYLEVNSTPKVQYINY